MSEYQYYEFQAIDRPLTQSDQAVLRAISSRARINGTSLTNTYEWGDFKGNPVKLMEQFFDLHLYVANWGARRLMMRLPKVLVQREHLDRFLSNVDSVTIHETPEHLILDISPTEMEPEDWDDGSGWLAALAPLRAELLGGDQRVLYLAWLMAVQTGDFPEDAPEPLPGIGPITGALEAFANFFGIDPGLVAAAAERQSDPFGPGLTVAATETIAAMSDTAKTKMLVRLFEGDPYAGAELRVKVRESRPGPPEIALRTAWRTASPSRNHPIRTGRNRGETSGRATAASGRKSSAGAPCPPGCAGAPRRVCLARR